MGVQAVKIDTEGVATVVDLGENTLKGLQDAACARFVDVVRLHPRLDMWIDDEGAVLMEPVVNEVASLIARGFGFVHQPYFGDVVFASHDDEGNTTSLSEHDQRVLLTAAERYREILAGAL